MGMKIAFGVLAVSVVIVLVAAVALLGRLRWHLRRPRSEDATNKLVEPAEKTNHS